MHKMRIFAVVLALIALVIVGCRPVEVDAPDAEGVQPNETEEFIETQEATAEATAEMTAEATDEAEATEEATVEATDEATAEATEEVADTPPTQAEEVETTTAQTMSTDVRILTFGFALAQAVQTGMVVGAENVDLETGDYTVFVPDEEALGSDLTADDLMALAGDADTGEFFGCYLVEGALTLEELQGMTTLTTISGEEITVEVDADGFIILNGEARITGVIQTANGYVYIVDGLVCDPAE